MDNAIVFGDADMNLIITMLSEIWDLVSRLEYGFDVGAVLIACGAIWRFRRDAKERANQEEKNRISNHSHSVLVDKISVMLFNISKDYVCAVFVNYEKSLANIDELIKKNSDDQDFLGAMEDYQKAVGEFLNSARVSRFTIIPALVSNDYGSFIDIYKEKLQAVQVAHKNLRKAVTEMKESTACDAAKLKAYRSQLKKAREACKDVVI